MDFGFEWLHAEAKRLKTSVAHLVAMNRRNDPFFVGAPAQNRDAFWFKELWERFSFPRGVHLRRIHYRLVSVDPPVLMPTGEPYLNTKRCQLKLNEAARLARHMGLVSPDLFSDHRNPEPLLHAFYPDTMDEDPGWWLSGNPLDWQLPSIELARLKMLAARLDMPQVQVDGYDYSLRDQGYHLEVWIEKSTMDDVLVPVCKRFHANLVRGVGYQSLTGIINLLLRINALPEGRPTRIFYISDFDGCGDVMPVHVARTIEFYLRGHGYAPDRDIKLQPIALTAEQVREYKLPKNPMKETDCSAQSFQERRSTEGAVELDALEAIYPGELGRLVSEVLEPYFDAGLKDRMLDAEDEARESAREQWREQIQEEAEQLEQLRKQIDELSRRYHPKILLQQSRIEKKMRWLLDSYEAELAPLREQFQEMQNRMAEAMEDIEIELPPRPMAENDPGDEVHFLYDSNRDYMEQLETYKRHQNKPAYCDMEILCKVCGTPFRSPKANALYCSDKCKQRSKRENGGKVGRHEKKCEMCGNPFRSKRSDARLCSQACRLASHRQHSGEK